MTREEWLGSDDPLAMLNSLHADWQGDEAGLVRLTHRYLLACCRAIWTLLPMEASRKGVEVAERYIEGQATAEEFHLAEWQAEGAAFFLEPEVPLFESMRGAFEEWSPDEIEYRRQYDVDRKARIEVLVKDIETIPVAEMRRMVRVVAGADNVPTRQLLADVAYFADTAMCYPGIRPREGAIERYSPFLSSIVLREVVDKYSGHDR